jgi:hypothetical protein
MRFRVSTEGKFPLVIPTSSGAAGVSAPVSVLPEALAEHPVLPKTVSKPAPVSELPPSDAAATVTSGLDRLACSFDAFYREMCLSTASIHDALTEALRSNVENAFRHLDELAVADGPMEAAKLQFGYVARQAALLADQASGLQSAVMRIFCWPSPR